MPSDREKLDVYNTRAELVAAAAIAQEVSVRATAVQQKAARAALAAGPLREGQARRDVVTLALARITAKAAIRTVRDTAETTARQ